MLSLKLNHLVKKICLNDFFCSEQVLKFVKLVFLVWLIISDLVSSFLTICTVINSWGETFMLFPKVEINCTYWVGDLAFLLNQLLYSTYVKDSCDCYFLILELNHATNFLKEKKKNQWNCVPANFVRTKLFH